MRGKVAVVTGGARGIGLDIATCLGEAGTRVVIADLDGDALQTAAEQLSGAGLQVEAVIADVSVVDDTIRMVETAVSRFGRLDVLVNNAGGSAHTALHIEDVTEEQFDRVMAWNVRGTFFCIKSALPHMRMNGGAIVNIASIAGRAGFELVSPQYSAAKAAIIGMSRNLAKHLGPDNIRVNVVAPGFIRSGPRAETIWQKRNEQDVLRDVALRRRGELRDISNAVLFLASDASGYVTGAVHDVNGGYLAV